MHTIRITGPGIDHAVLVCCMDDIEAVQLILDKIRRCGIERIRGEAMISIQQGSMDGFSAPVPG